MHRPQVKIVILAMMLMTASMCDAADPSGSAVTGVVRDAQGVVQMGALVQILAANSAMVGSALTDMRGRYTIAHLVPGKYQVRASAALFLPAKRGNLQLRAGAQAIVDLTLNTLFETSTWLPAERRGADEPGDDWKWTLRSAANRPILRWDENGDVITETSKPVRRVNVAVVGGAGGFGDGGVHTIVSQSRVSHSGSSASSTTMSADIGAPAGSFMGGPSARLAAQYSKKTAFAGEMSTVVSYQMHPEMVGPGGSAGLQVMQMASAQKISLGDMAEVEAGGTVYVVRTSTLTTASQPFLKVTTRPSSKWTVGYRLATAQNLQSYDGLDAVPHDLPPAAMSQGRLQTARGLHQEVAVGRKVGPGVIQVAYYHDSLDHVLLSGGGASGADIAQAAQPGGDGMLADSATGNFHLLGTGYRTQGVNITLSEPVTQNLWLALEYATGAALATKDNATLTAANVSSSLAPEVSQSATLALKGKVLQSGTKVRMAYRWQPTRFVSAVDPYAAFGDQAYLSCYIRQAIRMGHLLPAGLDATIDVTNLLAQGYKPFLSADGQTLFLAQAPRTVQAGLSFNF